MAQEKDNRRLWIATRHEGKPKKGFCIIYSFYLENGLSNTIYSQPLDMQSLTSLPEGKDFEHYADPDIAARDIATFLESHMPVSGKYTLCGYTPDSSAEWLDYLLYKAGLSPLSYYVSNEARIDLVYFSKILASFTSWNPISHSPLDLYRTLTKQSTTPNFPSAKDAHDNFTTLAHHLFDELQYSLTIS